MTPDGPPIVVLGATGAVGSHVAAMLARRGCRVVAVSRSAGRAEALAAPLPGAIGVAGTFSDPSSVAVDEPGLAINCTGVEDVASVRRWRRAGWSVIDITASSAAAVELAAEPLDGPPLLVGVGLIPGLTSVIAHHLARSDPDVSAITISCLIGLGEDYGEASRNWTLRQLGRRVGEADATFRNFSDPEKIEFPGGFGRRPAWRFDFADRALLPARLGTRVTTRYCFDSRVAGRALALASAVPGAPELLRRLGRTSRRAVGGTAWWAGVIETDTGARAWALGAGQSVGTAVITAIAAEQLVATHHPSPRYLWDVVAVDALITDAAEEGVYVGVEQPVESATTHRDGTSDP